MNKKGNMYEDNVLSWNVFVGCEYHCTYCKKSFQAQMRRQVHNCWLCGMYSPHFHKKRLHKKLPQTKGDEFIWVGSSGDISFIRDENMELILKVIKKNPDKTFFFQTKNPSWFGNWEFPKKNVILGITLETNIYNPEVSFAPKPRKRASDFYFIEHPRKCITIEPIMRFGFSMLLGWIRDIRPERIYIGYDSKKNNLDEPKLEQVKEFIRELKKITKKVKEKLLRKAWYEELTYEEFKKE